MKLLRKGRKLNNKGFTLIELLAVIVILAIVMGISATSVISSINNSRKSSLYSAAQTAAANMNTWVTEDFLITENVNKKLGDEFVKLTQNTPKIDWICLTSNSPVIMNKAGSGDASTSLFSALGLSENDIVIGNDFSHTSGTDPTCSAIRYNTTTASYEVVLVAKSGGKYYVGGEATHFAFSAASKANEDLAGVTKTEQQPAQGEQNQG